MRARFAPSTRSPETPCENGVRRASDDATMGWICLKLIKQPYFVCFGMQCSNQVCQGCGEFNKLNTFFIDSFDRKSYLFYWNVDFFLSFYLTHIKVSSMSLFTVNEVVIKYFSLHTHVTIFTLTYIDTYFYIF